MNSEICLNNPILTVTANKQCCNSSFGKCKTVLFRLLPEALCPRIFILQPGGECSDNVHIM